MRLSHLFVIALSILSLNCKGPEGPAGPPGSSESESLTDPALKPKVTYTFPPMNSSGPYDDFAFSLNEVQVRFNKIMDRALMKHAASLTSQGSTVQIDTNQIYSVGGDIYFLYIRDSLRPYYYFRWDVGRAYVLKVDSTAKDINGNYLIPSFSTSFTPEPNFRVKAVDPPNGATDVSIYSSPSLLFNSAVDSSTSSAIQITPPVSGHWTWYNNDSTAVGFSADSTFNLNTSYTISVNTSAQDKQGHHLPQVYHSTFTTSSFHVTSTNPQNRATDIWVMPILTVYFTTSIDTGSVRQAFSTVPPTTGSFYCFPGSTYFQFTPSQQLLFDTTYQVTLSTAMKSQYGDSLSQPYRFSFTTVPFKVTFTTPYNGATDISRSIYDIYVDFGVPIDTGTVRSSFSHPGMNGSFSIIEGNNYFDFFPETPLAAYTKYTMTIQTSMRSKSGAYLKTPYTFSFTTGN